MLSHLTLFTAFDLLFTFTLHFSLRVAGTLSHPPASELVDHANRARLAIEMRANQGAVDLLQLAQHSGRGAQRFHRGRRDPVKGGMTPLLYAAREGADAAVAVLIKRGADPELAEANGMTPLLMALLNNQLGAARQLIDAGPDIYRQIAQLPALPTIDAAVITHAHSDHFLGLDDLGAIVHDSGRLEHGLLPIYAPADNWPRIEATFGHLFRDGMFKRFEERTLLIDTDQIVGGFHVRPFHPNHTTDITTGMLLGAGLPLAPRILQRSSPRPAAAASRRRQR